MTFTIKHKRSDRPMVAEYLCPVHGKFALEVARDAEGNPPGEVACPERKPTRPAEYFALRMSGETDEQAKWLGCNEPSPFCISKTGTAKVRGVEVVRGGYQKPERPTWTDTTNLGEGQDLDDWIADRDKVWEADREASIKELLDG